MGLFGIFLEFRDVGVVVGSSAEVQAILQPQSLKHDIKCRDDAYHPDENRQNLTCPPEIHRTCVHFFCWLVEDRNRENDAGKQEPHGEQGQADVESLADYVEP